MHGVLINTTWFLRTTRVLGLGAKGIGLDIGAEQVKAVALKKRGQQFILAGTGLSEIPLGADDDTVAQAVQAALREAGAGKRPTVCTAVGGPSVVIKGIKMPPLPLSRVLEAVTWNFREHGLIPAGEAIFDAQVLGTSAEGQMHILAVCAPRELFQHRLRILRLAGVTPRRMEVGPLAILNAVLTLQGVAKDETVILLSTEAEIPFLCIYQRSAGAPLVRYFQDQYQSAAELIAGIRTAVAYFQSELGVSSALRFVYCGKDSVFSNLKGGLQGLLALWNHPGDPTPFDPLSMPELTWEKSILPAGKTIAGPQLVQAVGLAIAAL